MPSSCLEMKPLPSRSKTLKASRISVGGAEQAGTSLLFPTPYFPEHPDPQTCSLSPALRSHQSLRVWSEHWQVAQKSAIALLPGARDRVSSRGVPGPQQGCHHPQGLGLSEPGSHGLSRHTHNDPVWQEPWIPLCRGGSQAVPAHPTLLPSSLFLVPILHSSPPPSSVAQAQLLNTGQHSSDNHARQPSRASSSVQTALGTQGLQGKGSQMEGRSDVGVAPSTLVYRGGDRPEELDDSGGGNAVSWEPGKEQPSE